MSWKKTAGVGAGVGAMFAGPLGAAIGGAFGAGMGLLFDDDDSEFEDDEVRIDLVDLVDEDGVALHLLAPFIPDGATPVIWFSRNGSYLEAQDSLSLFVDSDGDARVECTPIDDGHSTGYLPCGVLRAVGRIEVVVRIFDQQAELLGMKVFNIEAPPNRAWSTTFYLRPWIQLLMLVARADGILEREEVREIRATIADDIVELWPSEQSELRDMLKAGVSSSVEDLVESIEIRYPGSAVEVLSSMARVARVTGVHDAELDILYRAMVSFVGDDRYWESFLEEAELLDRTAEVTAEYLARLELQPGATSADIKAAYRRLIKDYHPDKVATLPKGFQEFATQKARDLREAYEALIDEP